MVIYSNYNTDRPSTKARVTHSNKPKACTTKEAIYLKVLRPRRYKKGVKRMSVSDHGMSRRLDLAPTISKRR